MTDLIEDLIEETRDYTCEAGVYRPRLRVTLIPENVDGVPVSCDALVWYSSIRDHKLLVLRNKDNDKLVTCRPA